MKQKIISHLNTIKEELQELSVYIFENPEESFHEYKACNHIISMLKSNKFNVKTNFLQIPTSFYAEYGKGHPRICYLCEYDAVPEKGHITGHNLISAISLGAAISLSKVINKTGGSIVVLGCPGEFISGAKITMAKQGVFDDIDAVLMAHPDVITCESGNSKAIVPLKISYESNSGFTYRKKDNKYTALDACLFTFNTLNILSKGFNNGIDIDGVILKGGESPYLLPSKTESKFYIRADKMVQACGIESKIRRLVDTTSFIMDLKSEICLYELPYEELITNKTLSRLFSHNLKESGIIDIAPPYNTNSGLSIGIISHKTPCIHPFVSIIQDKKIKYSSPEFALATTSYFAQDIMCKTAQALALTGLDLIEKESLLIEAKKELF